MDKGAATLGLVAARFLERSCQTCTDACGLVGILVARLQLVCVEPFWSSSMESCDQTEYNPVSDSGALKKSALSCQDDLSCLAAVARFTSNATPVSCTDAVVSLDSTASYTNATAFEAHSLESPNTVLLRSAVLLAHMSSCISASHSGGRAEAMSWRCLMHVSTILTSCAQSGGSKDLTLEDHRLGNSLLWTLFPILRQAADNPKQQEAGRAICSILLAICSLGLAYQSHVAAFLLQSGMHDTQL